MSAHKKLNALLDKERDKLIASDLGDLENIAAQKTALIDRIRPDTIAQSDLSSLRQKLKRNQDLMEACSNGIKAAKQRLSDLLENRAGATTYTRDGTRTAHKTSQSLERRA